MNGLTKKIILLFILLLFISPIVSSANMLQPDAMQKLVLSVVVLVLILLLFKSMYRSKISLNKWLLILILIYPLSFSTAFFNGSSNLIFYRLTDILAPFIIAMIILLLSNWSSKSEFLKILAFASVIVSTVFCLIGLLDLLDIHFFKMPRLIPPGSTLGHRGFAVEYLLPAIPFLLIVKNSIKKKYYPVLFIVSIINFTFLFFTRSRSAIVVILILIIVYIIFQIAHSEKKERIRKIIITISPILIGFLISLIPLKNVERGDVFSAADNYFSTEYKSNQHRWNFWSSSIELIKEAPLTGVGIGKWSGYYPKYNGSYFTDSNITFSHGIHVHNDFLESAAENGLVNFLTYFFLLVYILFSLYRKSRLKQEYFFIFLSALAGICFSFLSFPMFKYSSYFYLAIALGLALNEGNTLSSKVLKVKSFAILSLVLILSTIVVATSYLKINFEDNFVSAMQKKNTSDFKGMEEDLSNIDQIIYPFDPSKQPINYYLGIAHYYSNNISESLEANLKARVLAPYNPLILQNIAAGYFLTGKTEKAIRIYDQLKFIYPNYFQPQINLLRIYSEKGFLIEGKILCKELLQRIPENPYLNQIRAQYYPDL